MDRAEFMDLIIGSWCLSAELVAGNVEDFQSLVMIIQIHFFDRCVLRSESAAGGRVYDQNDFPFQIGHFDDFTCSCRYGIIIEIRHFFSPGCSS